jgi:predicted nucleotidyltransferase
MNSFQKELNKKVEAFTERLKKVPEIIGIAYTGSTAKQTWDKYSDIDINVVVADKNYDKIVQMLPKLLSWWGEIKFWNTYKDWEQTYSFIGDDYLKVEIEPIKASYFKEPHLDQKNIKIIYDPKGILNSGKKISQKLKDCVVDKNYIRWAFIDTRSNLIYIIRHYLRGQKFTAVNEFTTVREDLFQIMKYLKKVTDYNLSRNAEKLLTAKERRMFDATNPRSYEKKEVKRLIKACWNFMKYLEKEYEKNHGKLNLRVDDKHLWRRLMKELK